MKLYKTNFISINGFKKFTNCITFFDFLYHGTQLKLCNPPKGNLESVS